MSKKQSVHCSYLININFIINVLLVGCGFQLKGYILLGFYEVICCLFLPQKCQVILTSFLPITSDFVPIFQSDDLYFFFHY